MQRIFILTIYLMCFTVYSFAQENCSNGIDDDGDMLIDLNDPDCECEDVTIFGLIPNPSFEEFSCCPQSESQLGCAVSWIQASGPTTDYLHTCGTTCHNFTGNCAPLPIPDGDGCIGFRDGKPGNENFKEYAGACLIEQMVVGTEYTIDFFTGFANRSDGASTSFEIGLYATTNCNNLPFGQGNVAFGCPTNGPGWVQLDQITLSGNNEWINTVFTFIADQAYAGIVLGPGCTTNPSFNSNPYFFFDRLLVAESSEFGVPFAEINGSICEDALTLVFEDDPSYTFQWYLDGIAIDDANNSSYTILNGENVEGVYSVIIDTEFSCFTSANYVLEIPSYENFVIESICPGESVSVGLETFSTSGVFEIPLIASDGCDSTVTLILDMLEHSDGITEATFCEGETFSMLGSDYNAPGTYDLMTVNAVGCDSSITLILDELENSEAQLEGLVCEGEIFSFLNEEFIDAGAYDLTTVNAVGCDSVITLVLDLIEPNEGLELGGEIVVSLGDSLSISPLQFDPDNVSYNWMNQSGTMIGDMIELPTFTPLENQMIFLDVFDSNGCPATDSVLIRVDRDIQVHVPNVFSPNGDSTNDDFLAYGNQSIIGLEEILIFDRWGDLVFSDADRSASRNIPLFNWDGKFNGQDATEGVYVYLITARVIDGTFTSLSGDVTLVR